MGIIAGSASSETTASLHRATFRIWQAAVALTVFFLQRMKANLWRNGPKFSTRERWLTRGRLLLMMNKEPVLGFRDDLFASALFLLPSHLTFMSLRSCSRSSDGRRSTVKDNGPFCALPPSFAAEKLLFFNPSKRECASYENRSYREDRILNAEISWHVQPGSADPNAE